MKNKAVGMNEDPLAIWVENLGPAQYGYDVYNIKPAGTFVPVSVPEVAYMYPVVPLYNGVDGVNVPYNSVWDYGKK